MSGIDETDPFNLIFGGEIAAVEELRELETAAMDLLVSEPATFIQRYGLTHPKTKASVVVATHEEADLPIDGTAVIIDIERSNADTSALTVMFDQANGLVDIDFGSKQKNIIDAADIMRELRDTNATDECIASVIEGLNGFVRVLLGQTDAETEHEYFQVNRDNSWLHIADVVRTGVKERLGDVKLRSRETGVPVGEDGLNIAAHEFTDSDDDHSDSDVPRLSLRYQDPSTKIIYAYALGFSGVRTCTTVSPRPQDSGRHSITETDDTVEDEIVASLLSPLTEPIPRKADVHVLLKAVLKASF